MKIFLHTFLLMMLLTGLHAQHPQVAKARALVNSGKSEKAVAVLQKAWKKSSEKEIALELIHIHAGENRLKEALEWAETAALDDSPEMADAVIYADLLIRKGAYQEALDKCIGYALRYEDALPLQERAYMCENLIRAEKNAVLYEVAALPFNSPYNEISIANYRRNSVMSSDRLLNSNDGSLAGGSFDLYLLQKEFNKWLYPSILLKEREASYNRTTLSYTTDGNHVYYTLSDFFNLKSRKKGEIPKPVFRIYRAASMGNEWVEAGELPFQKKGVNYKDPSIHPDGQTLVFASDEAGNYDLYQSLMKEGIWTEPESLGSQVNSPADESMPYFDEEGRLYFSSNRPGFGGFDLYETRLDDGIWLRPSILPPPFNSPSDDLSLAKHFGRTGGYFTSNRPGGSGGFDVYEFIAVDLKLGVTVLDASKGSLVELAEVALLKDGVELDRRLTGPEGMAEFQIGKQSEYEIAVSREGYHEERSSFHSRMAVDGKLLYWNIKLRPATELIPAEADGAGGDLIDPAFLDFTAEVVDAGGKPVSGLEIRLINTLSQKMKIVETDESGRFRQSLIPGNTYEFIMTYEDKRYVFEYSTKDLADMSPKYIRYSLAGE